ncbi:MAG: TolC family protein [Desulfobulbaceae bacterium]|nr:TolC family protein [Desulfobulbaceae bacterium]
MVAVIKNLLYDNLRTALLFCLVFPLLAGCVTTKKHTYESIRSEFSGELCNLDRKTAADTVPCSLAQPVSLTKAISIALDNNPETNIAVARIRQAEAMVAEAEAVFWPRLGLYTAYTRGNAPSAALFKTIDQRRLEPSTDFNRPGNFDNYETGINASINIFNRGRDQMNMEISRIGLDISRSDRQIVENEITAAVIRSYFDVMAARDYITIAEESVATVLEQLRVMKIRYEHGSVLKSDLLSLKVRSAQAREELVRSRNRLAVAKGIFAIILGIDPMMEIELKREACRPGEIPPDHTKAVKQALEKRPETAKLRNQLIQARIALDLAGSDYLPTLEAGGRYYFDDPDMQYDADRDNWTVVMMLNWELFSGFSTAAARRKSRAVIEELLHANRKLIQEIKLDVKTAYLRRDESESRMESAKSASAMAEESFNLVREQFDGGSATITRYLEAELAWNRAGLNETTAYYDWAKAQAEIRRSVGFFVMTEN